MLADLYIICVLTFLFGNVESRNESTFANPQAVKPGAYF